MREEGFENLSKKRFGDKADPVLSPRGLGGMIGARKEEYHAEIYSDDLSVG